MKNFSVIMLLSLVLMIVGCTSNKSSNTTITVFAAAGLKSALDQIIVEFEKEHEFDVRVNYASSGTLARQIEMGEQPAIYLSASLQWMEYIVEEMKDKNLDYQLLVSNNLVIVTPLTSTIDTITKEQLRMLPELFKGRISVGDARHVPVGKYTVEALSNLNLLADLEPRFLQAKDVRSALMVVELGEVELGIVYGCVANESKKIKVIGNIPEEYHSPLVFSSCLFSESDEAKLLYNYIKGDHAKNSWEKRGYKVMD